MAASGGYWISTPVTRFVANPSTLTGSIGIFGVITTVENSLDSIGVHTDGVSTSPLADVLSHRALPPEAQQMMQLSVWDLAINALSRWLLMRVIRRRSRLIKSPGSVWTGQDAKS
ncbi:S49 family peptidase [Escherichia coli]